METLKNLSTHAKPESRPFISVVIPSIRGATSELKHRLSEQSWQPDDIQVINDVSPSGRARNLGVSATRANNHTRGDQILIFIDDDALPGDSRLIEALVTPLINGRDRETNPVGVTGAARVLPPDANPFQRRVAAEIPRTTNPVPDKPIETNPPLKGYGHSIITTTCCATWYSIYENAGKFSEVLHSGEDTDFFYRVRKSGYRFIMVPYVFVEHPAPNNLRALISKYYWYGVGYAQEVKSRPDQRMGPRIPTMFHQIAFLMGATLWLLPNMFILYSYGYPRFELGFRPVKALSTFGVACGYVTGWRRGAH
jgi:GT2 family glycosyltransferase